MKYLLEVVGVVQHLVLLLLAAMVVSSRQEWDLFELQFKDCIDYETINLFIDELLFKHQRYKGIGQIRIFRIVFHR